MFLKHIDLTTALRPFYLPDEVLLFVQDNVGLYEGKFKLPNYQNGQVYLTTHRICYVDKEDPRSYSVALELKEVDRYEFYAGFFKSSAKITLIPKPPSAHPFYPLRSPGPAISGTDRLSHAQTAPGQILSSRQRPLLLGFARYAASPTQCRPTLTLSLQMLIPHCHHVWPAVSSPPWHMF
uniref:Vacuolar protein-sorting-associated protein 36 n=1 Tax=Bionectria ochroleuca TaxID=29856 RepID=A0A8H7N1N4_BIOOC